MLVEVGGTASNRFSAGGPSLLDVSPAEIRSGSETALTVRGINLSPAAALRIGPNVMRGTLVDGPMQTLRVTVPSRVVSVPGIVAIDVVDADAPDEPPSNFLTLSVAP